MWARDRSREIDWWAGRESNPHSRRRLVYSQRSSPPAQPTHCGGGTGSRLRSRGGPVTGSCSLGADDGTRTRNRRFTKPLLYQLSYVGATGRAIPQMTPSAPGNDRAGRSDGSSVGGRAGARGLRGAGGSPLARRHRAGARPRRSGAGARPVPASASTPAWRARRARRSPVGEILGFEALGGRSSRRSSALGAGCRPAGSVGGRIARRGRRLARPGCGSTVGIALGDRLEQQDGTGHGGVERPDRAAHRDPHEQVAAASDGGPEALALAADDDRERAAQVRLAGRQRRVRLGAGDPQAVAVQVGERARQVVDRAEQEVLDGARPTPSPRPG